MIFLGINKVSISYIKCILFIVFSDFFRLHRLLVRHNSLLYCLLFFLISLGYIDFWLDTIHCYATTESDQSVDEPPLDKLEPPIIIVCTGTDKVEVIKCGCLSIVI